MSKCRELESRLTSGASPGAAPDRDCVEHIVDCHGCRALWITAGLIAGTAPVDAGARVCPRSEEAREFAAGDTPASKAERLDLLEHLTACDVCIESAVAAAVSADMLETMTLAEPPRSLEHRALAFAGRDTRRDDSRASPRAPEPLRPKGRLLGLAAAAGLALVAVGLGLLLREPGGGIVVPSTGIVLRGDDAFRIVGAAPEGPVASAARVRFEWTDRGAGDAGEALIPRYRLVVVELESGSTVIDVETSATFHVLTADEADRLIPGTHYHWLVEAVGDPGGRPQQPLSFHITR